MSSPLQDVWELSRQLVGHFVENVAPCGTLPGDAIYGDVTTVTRICLELAVSMLDGRDIPEKTVRLQEAAAQWAREGVPVDTIHHAVHEGFKIGFELVLGHATGRTHGANNHQLESNAAAEPAVRAHTEDTGPVVLTSDDYANLVDGAKMLVEMMDTVTTAVSLAYLRELRSVVSEHHTAAHTLTSAILGGHPTSTMARECGIEIAERYHVVALSIPQHPEESNPMLDPKVVARRKLRRVQAEIATRCGETALSLLSVDGGTLLVPSEQFSGAALDELLEQLSQAARVPVTATVVTAATEAVPGAADQAHELLDIVAKVRPLPGLYRFDDLALEYQLTRPGPGLEYLGSLLDPLREHPDLLQTLQIHISSNLNRQRTARHLHVHTNTVDYRLKRIGQLTGCDPTVATGLWQLRSALVARTFQG